MTSKTGQQITAVGEGTIHSEPDGPAYGGPKASITVTGQKGGGTVVTLHQTRSNNANHAVVPVALCQKQKGGKGITGLRFDERNGFRFNRVAKIPSLTVEIITTACQRHRRIRILSRQQIHHQSWFAKSADGIDARCNLKSNVLGRQRAFSKTGQALKCLQALALGAMQVS
jgi:hypothetical protein